VRFSSLLIVGLAGSALVLGLWIRSYHASMWWPAILRSTGIQIHAWNGRIYATYWPRGDIPPDVFMEIHIFEGSAEDHPAPALRDAEDEFCRIHRHFTWKWRDYQIEESGFRNGYGFAARHPAGCAPLIGVPFWFLESLALVPAVVGMIRVRRVRLRNRRGQCMRCGYDLRMTSDRCPECGQCQEKNKRCQPRMALPEAVTSGRHYG